MTIYTVMGQVDPETVELTLFDGQSYGPIEKTMTTSAYPPRLDFLLLEDETGSFGDDITNMQTGGLAENIWDGLSAEIPDLRGAVGGFRDFAQDGWGQSGDWVYRRYVDLTPTKSVWMTGINTLTAVSGAGNDEPEAQLAALMSAANGASWDSDGDGDPPYESIDTQPDQNPTWDNEKTKIIILVTDASYHTGDEGSGWPGPTYAETVDALNTAGIHVIILATEGATAYYGPLAAATGGSVKEIEDGSADIVAALLEALEEIKTDVWYEVQPGYEDWVSMEPEMYEDVSGETLVTFEEYIEVPVGTPLGSYSFEVTFYENTWPEEGTEIGTQTVTVEVLHAEKHFTYTNVEFQPYHWEDPDGIPDNGDEYLVPDPAELGDMLPMNEDDNYVVEVVQHKNGKVKSTNPGQIYAVITITGAVESIDFYDLFDEEFDVNPAHLEGGVEVIVVDPDGYATILTSEPGVEADVDNDENTVDGSVDLGEPLPPGWKLMIYIKYKTAMKHQVWPNTDLHYDDQFGNFVLLQDPDTEAMIIVEAWIDLYEKVD